MKSAIFCSLSLLAGLAVAGGPLNQESTARGCVRIMSGITSPDRIGGTLGSGVVIANKKVGDDGWLVVLTADHVVSANEKADGALRENLGIGLGSAIGGASTGLPVQFARRLNGAKIDLAIVATKYGAFNANINNAVRTIAVTDPARKPASFTGVGYGLGLENETASNGWRSNGDIGQRRFYNNQKYTISEGAVATFGGYENQIILWKTLAPNSPDAMNGQGVAAKGDSGSPYFTTDILEESVGGNTIGTYSSGIFAIHSGSQQRFVNSQYWGQPYNSEQWGVFLNADNRTWIRQQIGAVPEPSSLAAFAVLVLGLMKRGSRQAS